MENDSDSSEEQEENVETSCMTYFIDGIPPPIQKIAEEDLGETDEVKAQCLKELKELLKDEPDLNPCTDDIFLLRFLRCRKYDVKRAFSNIINYYKFKGQYSGILTDRVPSEVKPVLDLHHAYGLEHRTPNYCGVALFRLGLYDFDEVDVNDVFASVVLLGESVMSCEAIQISGYSALIDMTDVSLRKLRHLARPSLVRRFVSSVQDTLPMRLNCIHFINNPFYWNVAINLMKRFLTKKMQDRLYVHGSDLESLHKHIPPEILPEELGGKQGPCAKYAKIFVQKMYDEEDEYIRIKEFGYYGDTLKELQMDNDLSDDLT